MSDVYKPAAYVIKKGRAEGFKFVINIDGKDEMVSFVNNKYDCPSAAHEAAIEALMSKPQFTQNIQKVDLAAGEAIAKAHMEAARNAAVQGGSTTETMKQAHNQVAVAESAEVAAALADDVVDALAADNLVITENVETKPAPAVSINIGGGSK